MADRSLYRDPVFDEVAAREERGQRAAERQAARAEAIARRRADPAYRLMRRRKVRRLVKLALAGKLR
jgi:hypothetical protein